MARSLNKVQIIGALGRDPDVRRSAKGDPIVNLRVATSESWKDKASGEWKEQTEWHSVVLFGEGLERATQALTKGSKVYVEGQLKTRKWTDQQGAEKYTTEIVVQGFGGTIIPLDAKPQNGEGGRRGNGNTTVSKGASRGGYDLGEDSELPF